MTVRLMATALGEDDTLDLTSPSDTDTSDGSTIDPDSDEETESREPCKFYNRGHCQDGNRCPYLHVCKFALRGNCRYGSRCRLNHPRGSRRPCPASSRASQRSESRGPKITDGRCYQWQLNDGTGWKDVENDHILEAHFCLPHSKSIKIYNTPYGAVSIDFNRMRVYGKRLRVRRLDDGNTVWLWYCTLRHKWIKYGDKDSKGNSSPVKSSDIEQRFQRNPSSSFTFNIGGDSVEIRFREMRQVTKKKKRKVTRRPQFRQRAFQATFQNLSLGTKPQWQFEGDSGAWHDYKNRRGTSTECSVTSDDIERKYQQNPQSSMNFTVSGASYTLDFRAMIQTNLRSKATRRVRRVRV